MTPPTGASRDRPPEPVIRYGPPPRRWQGLWVAIGVLAFVPAVAAVFMRLVPPTDDATAMSASFISYGVIAEVIALVFFTIALLRARHHLPLVIMTGLSMALLITQLMWLAPLFRPDHRPTANTSFTVASLNMRKGRADVAQLADKTKSADLVILVEVTRSAAQTVQKKLGHRFDHMTPKNPARSRGVTILSRSKLSDPQRLRSPTPGWAATAQVSHVGAVNVVAAHPCNPLCGGGAWMRDNHAVLAKARSMPDRPTFIAGDLNSVHAHRTIRDFAAHGYRTAADIAGGGWIPTYPADSWLPPLLPIDHVLINDRLTATSIRSFSVDKTDHRGLITRLAPTR